MSCQCYSQHSLVGPQLLLEVVYLFVRRLLSIYWYILEIRHLSKDDKIFSISPAESQLDFIIFSSKKDMKKKKFFFLTLNYCQTKSGTRYNGQEKKMKRITFICTQEQICPENTHTHACTLHEGNVYNYQVLAYFQSFFNYYQSELWCTAVCQSEIN